MKTTTKYYLCIWRKETVTIQKFPHIIKKYKYTYKVKVQTWETTEYIEYGEWSEYWVWGESEIYIKQYLTRIRSYEYILGLECLKKPI